MSLIKKIVELADRNDSIDAKKHVAKLSKEVKSYKEKVNKIPLKEFKTNQNYFTGSSFN